MLLVMIILIMIKMLIINTVDILAVEKLDNVVGISTGNVDNVKII